METFTSYDDDVYAWAYEQAALLREVAATRHDLPNELDIENLCEEIEGLARTDLREAESFLRLLLLHLLKLASSPAARAARHWAAESVAFQTSFQTLVARTILRKIDATKIWGVAIRQAEAQLDLEGDAILPCLPRSCPFSPEELAAEPFDVEAAVERIRSGAQAPAPT